MTFRIDRERVMKDAVQLMPESYGVGASMDSTVMVLTRCIVHALATEVERAHHEWLETVVETEPRVELLERAGVHLVELFERRQREPIEMPTPGDGADGGGG